MTNDPNPPTSPLSRALFKFSPQWFLVPQGTGSIALILWQLDYQFGALHILSKIVWIYTIVVLGLGVILYLLRLIRYPKHVVHELRHNLIETSCLSSIAITYTSIIQLAALQYRDSHGVGIAVYVLWWIDAFLGVVAVIAIPYVQLRLQPSGIEHLPPAVLLPLIAALTSAAGAGTLCAAAPISARLQVPVIIVAYLLIGAGLALALGYDAIILFQHFADAYPCADMVWQDMIICGPWGQSGFALQILGDAVRKTFPAYGRGTLLTPQAAEPIAALSQFAGVLSWGFGTFWWCFALMSIVHTLLGRPGGWRATRFHLGVWSLVFPWGVYTNCAVYLGKIMDSPAFKVWSTALLIMLVIIAIVLTLFTLKGIITGKILGLENGWREEAYLDKEA
ncbi:putative malic acid transport protein [Aspergillus clavatus NRRL 1]|uniref:Sulfite efflux pump SSU1 n=1 Tax=Aspergillus clavatus (strain ATCC 1007 / CBS 513.65 / DSM 816 / NCTC 3887 / NRRL 1 / QM 1276 / 107) TaxID=344612 RepID=A1CHP7_ASPCL|nr:malic acid transport protein, putative [Aspergillus clavatus NRRL 1]EAW10402.1 malic acid transport protein, putative [Aspergillus clavatus NRRL 1]